ncbi:unnamed protein product [Lactuca saligna]|uniref:Agenet domain-containing protein n=1 Tax=Lactuca saligna TaxID=75948 RepID=A0AA35VAH0_LACSI|nr:unnamed protein product [Lactuca saligna]
MEFDPFTKGSTVEVSSDEEGFHGAWYVATLVDIVEASPKKKRRSSSERNRNKKKVGYLVRYATLFEEDDATVPLTEIVHPSYVRPLPPRNPRLKKDNKAGAEAETDEGSGGGDGDGDFQLNDVVDAYLRDGWWIGVVRKVVVVDGEMTKYLISFESPPEEIEFEASQIRLHVDWTKSGWKLRRQKKPNQESTDKNTTHTSESNNDAHSDFITPNKASMTDSPYLTVGHRVSAKKRSHSRKKAVTNVEKIGVVNGSITYHRTRRIVNVDEEEEEDVRGNFQSSAVVENSGSKGNTEDMVSMIETSGTQAKDQELLLLEQEMITNETTETQDGNSQLKRKRGRKSKLPFQSPNDSLEDDNQETGKKGSSGVHEITTEDEQPLSLWYHGLQPLPVFKKSSCHTTLDHDEPIDASNAAMVNGSQTTENHHVWPFVKRSPIWATIESTELFQNLSQNPHFSPLWETKEDCREGLAIAHMVTFANVVQRTTNLQWTDSNHLIKNTLETLVDLEANGFDVGPVRARLDELLANKDEAGRLEGEMKEAEKEVEKCNREKMAIDEEINGLERKMRDVEEKMVKAVAMKNVKDEEVMVVRSKLQVVSKRIADWKLAFEELVGSPL